MNTPIASIITPTYGRESFLPKIYDSFSKQNIPNLEWLVLDDSPAPSAFMRSLKDSRVHYEYLSDRVSIGEKRNRLINKALSDVIVHFDDDDYYSPQYVQVMIEQMKERNADFIKLCGYFLYSEVYKKFGYWDQLQLTGLHFKWSDQPIAFSNITDPTKLGRNEYAYGFSYVYKKSVWIDHNFPDRNWGEDGVFIQSALDRGVPVALLSDDIGLCLHVLHQLNTSSSFLQYELPTNVAKRIFPNMVY